MAIKCANKNRCTPLERTKWRFTELDFAKIEALEARVQRIQDAVDEYAEVSTRSSETTEYLLECVDRIELNRQYLARRSVLEQIFFRPMVDQSNLYAASFSAHRVSRETFSADWCCIKTERREGYSVIGCRTLRQSRRIPAENSIGISSIAPSADTATRSDPPLPSERRAPTSR